MVRKDAWNDFNVFEFTKARCMAQDVIYPGEVLCVLEKKVKFIILGWNFLWLSIRSNWSIVSFKVFVSLLIFCLSDPSIGVSWVLVSHYYCVIVNFPFHFFLYWVIFHCVYSPQLIYSSVDGHLCCLHALAIVSSATMTFGVHMCCCCCCCC